MNFMKTMEALIELTMFFTVPEREVMMQIFFYENK